MATQEELARRALERIAKSSDPKELRRMADNAKSAGNAEIRDAAMRKLFAVSPEAQAGTLEHAVWQSIFALEGALTEERCKTTLLSRTRQKIAREGELQTVTDLVNKPPSDGYRMLLERGWPELTFEAIALMYPQRFSPEVRAAARKRLMGSGLIELLKGIEGSQRGTA